MSESISPLFNTEVIPRGNPSLGALVDGSRGGKTQHSAKSVPSNAYAYGKPVNI